MSVLLKYIENMTDSYLKTIAFYIGGLSKGGAERVMINLAGFFKENGYRIYLVTKAKEADEYNIPDGITRIVADITPDEEGKSRVLNLLKRIIKLRRIWKEIKPNIIVSFIRKNNLMTIASSRGLSVPVLVGIRSNPERELAGGLFKKLSFFMFRFADGIIVQTKQGKDFFPDYLKKKVVVLPNSLTDQFIDKEVCDYSKRKKEIVAVGRIDSNKNQKMLLDAFCCIKDEYPEWSLKLYGDGEDKDLLSNQYVDDRIEFCGQIDSVADEIYDASIFVLPSKQEGMPNALIEAMALGIACISTDCPCGGPAELISDGVDGIFISVDDTEGLINSLRELMDNSDKRELIGNNALDIRERLNPDIVNDEWKRYIEGFLTN